VGLEVGLVLRTYLEGWHGVGEQLVATAIQPLISAAHPYQEGPSLVLVQVPLPLPQVPPLLVFPPPVLRHSFLQTKH